MSKETKQQKNINPRNSPATPVVKSLPVPTQQASSRKSIASSVNDVDDEDEDEEGVVYMVVPPDGGWGWIVMIASILINCVTDGQVFAFGTIIPALTKEFQSAEGVAMIASMLTGTELFVGPIVSALCNRWGFRPVTIVGSLMISFGFSISYFATSTTMLCFTYGLIGGVGIGMAYVPSIVIVGFYFERWRGLANGFSTCGSSLGGFVLSFVYTISVQEYGWRITFLIQAVIAASGVIFALTYRPLLPVRVILTPSGSPKMNITRNISTSSLQNYNTKPARRSIGLRNTDYPTLAQQMGNNVGLSKQGMSRRGTTTLYSTRTGSIASYISGGKVLSTLPSRRMSLVDPDATSMNTVYIPRRIISGASIRMMPTMAGDVYTDQRKTCCGIVCCKCCHKRKKYTYLGVRPMYRDDAHYTGSLKMLPEYIATGGSIGYHMTVTRLPTVTDVEQEYSSKCVICPEAVTRALATMFDVSLLRSPSFILFCLSGCISFMGYFVPYMFITERANQGDIHPDSVKYLLMTLNIANTIGRVIGGFLTSFRLVNPLLMSIIALLAGGIATVISGLSTTFAYQMIYCVTYGFAMALVISLRTLILVDLLGLEKLTNAFGLLLLSFSFFNILGLSTSGLLIKSTGSYDVCFWYGGAWLIASGVMLIPLKYVNRREKAKAKKKEQSAARRP